jgi:acetyl-CoA synthetase
VITADATVRAGKVVPLKQTVDEAILGAPSVQKVLIHRHSNQRVPMGPGRDLLLSEIVARQRPYCDPEPMNSEDPLFILYTSGSTGNYRVKIFMLK